MNEPEAERTPITGRESAVAAQPDAATFELPDQADSAPVRMRRGLFGYRPADVEAELAARRQELVDLRRDVAALWLAFAQHERTIHRVLESLQRLGGDRIEPPGGRGERVREATPSPSDESSESIGGEGEGDDEIATRLSELDHVLEAIERATASLERSQAGELERLSETPEPAPEQGQTPDRDLGDRA